MVGVELRNFKKRQRVRAFAHPEMHTLAGAPGLYVQVSFLPLESSEVADLLVLFPSSPTYAEPKSLSQA